MRKIITLAALTLALPLAACDPDVEPTRADLLTEASREAAAPTTQAPEPEPTTEEPTEEPEATPEVATSDRGYIVKEIGQPGGIVDDATGEPIVTFTLDEINTAYECTTDEMLAEPPANGHYVAFGWTVQTGAAEAMAEAFFDSTFTLSEFSMQVLDADGKRVNDVSGNAMWCADSSVLLPNMIGPRQSAEGIIVLDLPVTTGTLVIDGTTLGMPGGGWEWGF